METILLITLASWMTFCSVSSAKRANEAKISMNGPCVRLRTSTTLYPEGGGTYHAFPDEFDGCRITSRELNSTEPLVFSVKRAGLVRIAAVGGLVSGFKRKGWEEIGRISILTDDGHIIKEPIYILEKRLDVGEYSIPSHGNFGVRLLVR